MRVCCGIIAVVVLLGNVDSAAAQGESLRLIWDRLRATLSRDLKSASENISSFFLSSLRLKELFKTENKLGKCVWARARARE